MQCLCTERVLVLWSASKPVGDIMILANSLDRTRYITADVTTKVSKLARYKLAADGEIKDYTVI